MFKMNPLLLLDYYKTTHHDQYPTGLTKLVSYLTPRKSRIFDDKVVVFGLQGFIKEYLIDYFNENFFNVSKEEVLRSYSRVLNATLGSKNYNIQKIADLYDLGYLPIQIKAIEEGTRVPMKTPVLEITNTHPDFAWLVNTIESLMSSEMWHSMIAATVGFWYKRIVKKYYDETVDYSGDALYRALGDFSFRGAESTEAATKGSVGWLASFYNTATVPAILYAEKYYNCDCDKDVVGLGQVSAEHSTTSCCKQVYGDERTTVKLWLETIYKDSNFTYVSDTYDYWEFVKETIPSLKAEILAHNGCFLIRGDSGDPVDIALKTIPELWSTFGGTINSKGYKVLNPKIGFIYGDSITIQRCAEIYEGLKKFGFASSNVKLGVGSFSMEAVVDPENGVLQPFTRDTYNIAVKATYAEIYGKPLMIFKDPKTDTGAFKKSNKGMCVVAQNEENGSIKVIDGFTSENIESANEINILETVFKDGVMIKEQSLNDIRNVLNSFVEKE